MVGMIKRFFTEFENVWVTAKLNSFFSLLIFSIVVNCIFMFDFDNQTMVTTLGLPDFRFRFVTKIPTEIYNTQGGCRFTTFEIAYLI